MSKVHVKIGDTVILLTGKHEDKYEKNGNRKIGKVAQISHKEGKVIVEGFNVITKHIKPQKTGQNGRIIKTEAPIYACKVQLICPNCRKPIRVSHIFEDGKKLRVCKKCRKSFK